MVPPNLTVETTVSGAPGAAGERSATGVVGLLPRRGDHADGRARGSACPRRTNSPSAAAVVHRPAAGWRRSASVAVDSACSARTFWTNPRFSCVTPLAPIQPLTPASREHRSVHSRGPRPAQSNIPELGRLSCPSRGGLAARTCSPRRFRDVLDCCLGVPTAHAISFGGRPAWVPEPGRGDPGLAPIPPSNRGSSTTTSARRRICGPVAGLAGLYHIAGQKRAEAVTTAQFEPPASDSDADLRAYVCATHSPPTTGWHVLWQLSTPNAGSRASEGCALSRLVMPTVFHNPKRPGDRHRRAGCRP